MANFPTPGQSTFTAPEEQAMRADARERRQQLEDVSREIKDRTRPLPKEIQDSHADDEINSIRPSREKSL